MQNIQTLLAQGWQLTMWCDPVTKRYTGVLSRDGQPSIFANGGAMAQVLLRLDQRAQKILEVAI